MPVLQRIVKPTTHKGKKVLLSREPKLIEEIKKTLFIPGPKTSSTVSSCMKDLYDLKKPDAKMLSKRNNILPFENPVPLEGFSKKHLSSLFVFGSHSKKRPHNLVLGRMYDYQLLDMVELGVKRYQGLQHFKNEKVAVGLKPCLLFVGELFQHAPTHLRLRSLLTDMFHREAVPAVRLQGLEHVLLFTADEDCIHLRSYRILLKKSGCRTPRIELDEIGPSIDFTLRRTKLASDDLFKLACKSPKELKVGYRALFMFIAVICSMYSGSHPFCCLQTKKVKNVSRDKFGTKHAQIHIPRQNIGTLQTRKMKGLKKTASEKKAHKRQAQERANQDSSSPPKKPRKTTS
ncbi:ribosome production factor 2 homolog isoform X1 [Bacillus rossius redtenbacheri]|uniref:ribosome production factor 2 homolog isoform X1 n=1 Tax=Bacillus rossius redtenbacheri TaxID=93214 RepID=UPI002FDEE8B8